MRKRLKYNGVVVFSHYRAGGTYIKNVLTDVYEAKEYGVEFDIDILNPEDSFNSHFKTDLFKIYLVNNPISISWILQNKIDYIFDNFKVIMTYRENYLKSLLSLSLWEKFIKYGLFDDDSKWTDENMKKFHDDLILEPISYNQIYTGIHLNVSDSTHEEYLYNILTIQTSFYNQLMYIKNKFKIKSIEYEKLRDSDYVFNFISKNLVKTEKDIMERNKKYIPYISNQYLDYFDDVTKKVFKQWGYK